MFQKQLFRIKIQLSHPNAIFIWRVFKNLMNKNYHFSFSHYNMKSNKLFVISPSFNPLEAYKEKSFLSFVICQQSKLFAITSEYQIIVYERTGDLFQEVLIDSQLVNFNLNGLAPYMFYCEDQDLVLILQGDTLIVYKPYFISQNKSLNILDLSKFLYQSSGIRKKSELYKNYIISVMSNNVIQIYKITNDSIVPIQNIQEIEKIVDFAINDDILYLLTEKKGIKIISLTFQNTSLLSHILMEEVGSSNGTSLIAVTKNIAFVVYKNEFNNLQILKKYELDLINLTWKLINQIQLDAQINNIFLQDEFFILQGFNTKIILVNSESNLEVPPENSQKLFFENVRKLEVIATKKNIFTFIGITRHNLFIKVFSKINPFVSCFTNKDNLIGQKFDYVINYNLTNEQKLFKQKQISYSIAVVEIEFSNDDIQLFVVILISFLAISILIGIENNLLIEVFFVIATYRNYKKQRNILEEDLNLLEQSMHRSRVVHPQPVTPDYQNELKLYQASSNIRMKANSKSEQFELKTEQQLNYSKQELQNVNYQKQNTQKEMNRLSLQI